MRAPAPIRYRELKKTDWPHVARLFGPNGACAGCWCMWWRLPRGGKLWLETKGERARRQFRRRIEAGRVHGVLAFDGKSPVGWCTFGPRDEFPRLDRTRAYSRPDDAAVWSIPCFFIARAHRGRGVCRGLLGAAVGAVEKRGARIVEGYPVTPTEAGKRLPAAFSYTGPLKVFEEAGFEVVQRKSRSRPLVRRALGRRSGSARG